MLLPGKSHYGFDPAVVTDVERLDVDEPGSESDGWLSRRTGNVMVYVVFDRHKVGRMGGASFVRY